LIKSFHPDIWKIGLQPVFKIKDILLIILFFPLAGFFQKAEPGKDAILTIRFRAYVHGEPLQLNKNYKNPFGETFGISRFRFYAGKIAPIYVHDDPGINHFTVYHINSSTTYHLIDFSDSASTSIELPVTAGDCNGIRFQLGIDSIDQNRGAQTGALDPVKGMFWTWNSGYLSIKIEGYSPVSNQPAHVIAYHIGGYRYPYNTVWKIKLSTTNDEPFRITKENKIIVEIPVDLYYFFDGYKPLHIREIPTCTTVGELARNISENFIGTFTGLTLTSNP
jgi:hypothetical protein